MDPIIRLDPLEQTRAWRIGLLCACAAILTALIVVQQHGRGLHETTFEQPPPDQRAREVIYNPGVAPLTVESKILVMVATSAAGNLGEADLSDWLAELEPLAITRVERLRFAIVLADVGRADDAIARLEGLHSEATPGGGIQLDAEWLLALYRGGLNAVPEAAQDALQRRHGWFGRLALDYSARSHDPYRRFMTRRLVRIDRFQTWVGLGFFLAIVLGIGSLALIIVHLRRCGFDWHNVFSSATQYYDHTAGRMLGPAAGGDAAMLEMVALFLLGLLLAVGAPILAYAGGVEGATATLVATELLMWMLLAVIAWPLLRGVEWGRLREDLGLTRGAGIGREAVFGLLGYTASLPLLIVASLLGAAIEEAIRAGTDAGGGASGYPLMEQPMAHSWAAVLLSALGAVVWAPVLEEVIFRGALYRFLRARMRAIWTVLITAAAFAIAHPYSPVGLLGVFVGGVVFGLLREWRGSLVAPMVAHAIHNAVVVGPTIVYLQLLEM